MKRLLRNETLLSTLLMLTTALGITVTGIMYHQSFLRILPLYVSLFIGILSAHANRYANLLGGVNSIFYMFVYLYLGLYASAGYALLFSCPVQLITFFLWSRRAYGNSTWFRSMTWKQRGLVLVLFLIAAVTILEVLQHTDSNHQLLDTFSSLLGILNSILTMLAFIEYTWISIPGGVISIMLNFATMTEHPEQITYLIYSFYSLICILIGIYHVQKLYSKQTSSSCE